MGYSILVLLTENIIHAHQSGSRKSLEAVFAIESADALVNAGHSEPAAARTGWGLL